MDDKQQSLPQYVDLRGVLMKKKCASLTNCSIGSFRKRTLQRQSIFWPELRFALKGLIMPKKPPKLERLVLTLPKDQLRELERRAIKRGLGITLYAEQIIRNHLNAGGSYE